jgi:hypothetical protein
VLVTRGGELAAPLGPLCDDPDCDCAHELAALDSAYPADVVTVADRDDVTTEDLIAACAGLLHRTGWADSLGPTDTAELAADMATEVVDAASKYPAGTLLHPWFDRDEERWTYIAA